MSYIGNSTTTYSPLTLEQLSIFQIFHNKLDYNKLPTTIHRIISMNGLSNLNVWERTFASDIVRNINTIHNSITLNYSKVYCYCCFHRERKLGIIRLKNILSKLMPQHVNFFNVIFKLKKQ